MYRINTLEFVQETLQNDIYLQIDTNPLTFYTELGIIIKALFILNKGYLYHKIRGYSCGYL